MGGGEQGRATRSPYRFKRVRFRVLTWFARCFCNKKGKQHKFNIEKSRNYYFPSSLNIYNFDCITQNPEETVMIVPSSEEVGAVTPVEEEPESEKVASPECSSNTFIGQKQADGSWKTVCKE